MWWVVADTEIMRRFDCYQQIREEEEDGKL